MFFRLSTSRSLGLSVGCRDGFEFPPPSLLSAVAVLPLLQLLLFRCRPGSCGRAEPLHGKWAQLQAVRVVAKGEATAFFLKKKSRFRAKANKRRFLRVLN